MSVETKKKESEEQIRRAREAVGEINYARLLDQGRLVRDALKAGRLEEVKRASANIGRIFDGFSGPILKYRAGHLPLESIASIAERNPMLGGRSPARADTMSPVTSVVELGKLVREARKGSGMSQQRFADLAGVGRRFLSELESGKPSLEIGRVLAVCKAAGIDLFARTR